METDFQAVAEEAARIGGKILDDWADKFSAREKAPKDLVTEADFASQAAISEFILNHFPDHQFLGEEGEPVNVTESPYRWIVDPLDGTSNYVHRFPYYGVSIGLEYAGEMIVGVVLDPNRNELFSAAKGKGTTLNGKPVQPSERKTLGEALVVASLPVTTDRTHPVVEQFLRVLSRAQHLQRTGSAALNLAYVAAGRIDGYWSCSLKPWDMAAGAILVTEAGGHVSKINGDAWEVDIPDLLASNGSNLHTELQPLLTESAVDGA